MARRLWSAVALLSIAPSFPTQRGIPAEAFQLSAANLETFNGCGMEGSATKPATKALNRLKNRYTAPGALGDLQPAKRPDPLPDIAAAPVGVDWLQQNALQPFLKEVRVTDRPKLGTHRDPARFGWRGVTQVAHYMLSDGALGRLGGGTNPERGE